MKGERTDRILEILTTIFFIIAAAGSLWTLILLITGRA